jgi:thiamine pyrophosphate-dependent acetolactate synthase large subunit-like protein
MPGMHGSYASNMALTECDLLIALGVRFDDRVTGRLSAFAPHAKVIHVDIDPAEIGKNRAPDLPIVGDAQHVLRRVIKVLTELEPEAGSRNSAARTAWWRQIRAWKEEHPLTPAMSAQEIKPQHLMAEVDRISGGNAIVTSDVGQHQMWAAQFVRFNAPRLWLSSGGLGSMGFSIPAAMGAQFAHPDKLVIALVGDGGFQMSLPELSTISAHHLPLKIVIVNNGYLGMVRQWQELFYNNRICATELESFPDAELLAAAYRIQGRVIEFYAAGHFAVSGKQARRPDAHHGPAQRPRVQHREPHRGPHARSDALADDHRRGRGRQSARAGGQADEQAHQRASGHRSDRVAVGGAGDGAAARPGLHADAHRDPEGSGDLRRARRRFLGGGLRAGGHGRPREAG